MFSKIVYVLVFVQLVGLVDCRCPRKKIDYCNQCGINPCIDGGQCTNSGNSYRCTYPTGVKEIDCPADVLFSSCKDVFNMTSSDSGPISGEYYLTNDEGETYKVYCEFYDTYFYTFIAPTNLTSIPVAQLYNDPTEILIRFLYDDGIQYQTTYGQIDKYSDKNISIQYSESDGYKSIRNTPMGPYLYSGLLLKDDPDIIHDQDIQGYSVNGVDKTFKNCDGNPNNYFALLYNANNAVSDSYNVDRPFMRHWITNGRPVPCCLYLPDYYFSFFEMHMGGCGGYITLEHIQDMTGVVFGLRYNLP